MRDEILEYEADGVRPFGVNPASAESHAAYAERLGLTFPLLSDPGLAISRAYGALRPDGGEISRSVVLVDQGGSVRYSHPGAPGADIVLESLRSP